MILLPAKSLGRKQKPGTVSGGGTINRTVSAGVKINRTVSARIFLRTIDFEGSKKSGTVSAEAKHD